MKRSTTGTSGSRISTSLRRFPEIADPSFLELTSNLFKPLESPSASKGQYELFLYLQRVLQLNHW